MKLTNPFKKTMNNTFLTESEILHLKKLKAEYVNDAELSEFSKWLDNHGKKITLDNHTNRVNVWNIVYQTYLKTVMNRAGNEVLTSRIMSAPYQDMINDIVVQTINKLPADYEKYRQYSLKLNLSLLRASIYNYLTIALDRTIDFNFDYRGFILKPDFDLSIYSANSLNSDLNTNTMAIASAYSKFFETVCKPLNDEQKAIVKDNFIESLDLFLKVSTPDMLKAKESNFRKITDFFYRKTANV